MPPKPKFTRDEIVATALGLVSRKGVDALTARELGEALGSSARPIFTVFKSMEEVRDEVRAAAMERFDHFSEDSFLNMPLFKQVGMKMVLFGIQEPKLYQLLFMQESRQPRSFEDIQSMLGEPAVRCIRTIEEDYGLTPEKANLLFENMWLYTFGMGALCATKVCQFSQERLSELLSTQFQALMLYVRASNG